MPVVTNELVAWAYKNARGRKALRPAAATHTITATLVTAHAAVITVPNMRNSIIPKAMQVVISIPTIPARRVEKRR